MTAKKWLTPRLFFSVILLTFLAQYSYAGRLYIDVSPNNANIYLMNIMPKFEQGMRLQKGAYDVLVTKNGYQPYRDWVKVDDNDKKLTVTLLPLERYALTINTLPADANIYIMNIEPKFEQGMLLPPGKYDVLIKKAGLPSKRQWVEIIDSAVSIDLNLEKNRDAQIELIKEMEMGLHSQIIAPPEVVTVPKYHLYVKTTPPDAEVQFLNVQEKFQQGMLLPAGQYYLRIVRQGYPTRRQWIAIEDKDVTLTMHLSSLPLCFFNEEAQDEMEQSTSILRSVTLKFYEDFVDASYYVQNMPSGLTNYSQFRGVKQGETLNLIGLIDYEGQQEELKVQMQLHTDRLLFNIDGSQHTLMQTNCRDTPNK